MIQSKMIQIEIPHIINVGQLLQFLTCSRGVYNNKIITLDFINYHFVKPFHITPLACLVEELKLANNVVYYENMTPAVRSYLNTVGFLSLFEQGADLSFIQPGVLFEGATYVKLWKIDAGQIDAYISSTVNLFKNNNLVGKNLDALNISLAEDFNNIIDHSQSAVSGYAVTQYYPNREELMISICDFGIGIPTKINNFEAQLGRARLSDKAAMGLALTYGFSTKSTPRNRGFGLSSVIDCVKGLHSGIKIISNEAIYMIDNQGDEYTLPIEQNFLGIMIVITLNTKNLPLDEDFVETETYL